MMHCNQRRNAYTLLELVVASAITAAVLVSTMALTRDSVVLSRRVELRSDLTTLAVSKLEQHMAMTAAGAANGTSTGHFAAEGRPSIRYRVVRSDHRSTGGLPGRLMCIRVTVWHDAKRNGALDQDELSITLSTKVAHRSGIQNAANHP